MTTTGILVTHGWPCKVTTTDKYDRGDETTMTVTTRRVDRYQSHQFVMTETRTVAFEELTHEGWEADPRKSTSDGSDGA